MSEELEGLAAEFPREVRGYCRASVDAFVRDIGARLDSVERRLAEEKERSREAQAEVKKLRGSIESYSEKEAAIAGAVVAMEQRRVTVDGELRAMRKAAEMEVEEILVAARAEAKTVVAEAREQADKLAEDARGERETHQQRLRDIQAEYAKTLERVRGELRALLALVPASEVEEPQPVLAAA